MKCRLPIILSTTSPVLSAADTQLAVLASTSSSHKNRSLKQVGTTSSVAMVFPSLARRRFLLSFESSHLYRRRYHAVNKSFANIFLQVVIPVTRLHSNLVWATASCLARWTTSRHTWNPIQCLLLHISLQELNTLDVLEVLVQSCAKL